MNKVFESIYEKSLKETNLYVKSNKELYEDALDDYLWEFNKDNEYISKEEAENKVRKNFRKTSKDVLNSLYNNKI